MANANGEKLIATLPSVRVTEQMETDLMRVAALEDRPLSDLIRYALSQWLYGHGRKSEESSEK